MVVADLITLFEALLTPPKDGGELVFDDEAQDPIQGCLHRLQGQPVASQPFPCFGKKRE